MTKYKVLKPVKNKYSGKLIQVGEVIELSDKRYKTFVEENGEEYFEVIKEDASK
ncbi:hypothetical protein [Ignavigranum ruoffiae]|uniref:hypothetical protein n=1 Tax=Ignavigranum ruoffiae TaxID=89093 RepID=UPI002353A8AF|nr:hypothetical protein [Ignavigranum ruoffiae]